MDDEWSGPIYRDYGRRARRYVPRAGHYADGHLRQDADEHRKFWGGRAYLSELPTDAAATRGGAAQRVGQELLPRRLLRRVGKPAAVPYHVSRYQPYRN